MTFLRSPLIIMIAAVFLLAGCGPEDRKGVGDGGSENAQFREFESENQVIARLNELKEASKTEEALDLLTRAQKQFPGSLAIIGEKFMILRAENRYKECVDMINANINHFNEGEQARLLLGKQAVLLPLIQSELEDGYTDQAYAHLEEMADAGYRGFHRLNHSETFAPLRGYEGFADVMTIIAHNTGIGSAAIDFTATLTDGHTFTLSEQKGTVVMVDFWSTTCPPCIEELPNLRKIYADNKSRGFEIISISLDDDEEKLEAFLAENPMPWKKVFSGRGWSDEVARSYRIDWIPSIWLVDKQGILRYFDVRGDDLRTAIEELVAE